MSVIESKPCGLCGHSIEALVRENGLLRELVAGGIVTEHNARTLLVKAEVERDEALDIRGHAADAANAVRDALRMRAERADAERDALRACVEALTATLGLIAERSGKTLISCNPDEMWQRGYSEGAHNAFNSCAADAAAALGAANQEKP